MSTFGTWLFLEPDELRAMHAHAIEVYGGDGSPPQTGCLERSLAAAVNASLYASDADVPDLLIAVAYLLVYLVKNHCFVDGNKRVAWMALYRTLDLNGFALNADEEDAAQLVGDIAVGSIDASRVVLWLAVPGRLESSLAAN